MSAILWLRLWSRILQPYAQALPISDLGLEPIWSFPAGFEPNDIY